jgi:hypothetical protein
LVMSGGICPGLAYAEDLGGLTRGKSW